MQTNTISRGAVHILLIALLFVYSHKISFAQQRVMVHEFSLLNESPEEIPEFGAFLKDTAFLRR